MNSFVLVGMSFGDEGKGTFVDYLAHEQDVKQIIRYNGGSQASHTVITPDGLIHKFSQLGSGMFVEDSRTYLSSNMVVNPFNLLEEASQFSKKTGQSFQDILHRIFIDENCYIVTPYHKLINKVRELSKGDKRRGSVGTGVSEVRKLLEEEGLGVQVKYLRSLDYKYTLYKKLEDLYYFTRRFVSERKEGIDPILFKEHINEAEVYYLADHLQKNAVWMEYLKLILYDKFNICSSVFDFYQKDETCIFEGSQGLLLDVNFGLRPNTTILDTTNIFAIQMCENIKGKQVFELSSSMTVEEAFMQSQQSNSIVKIGITKAFSSRHGRGSFPTEDTELNHSICDENQEETYWNGSIRFGWFDAVLIRYAQSVNQVDEIYLSSIDKLSLFSNIKICNSYIYTGCVDEAFENMFDYELNNGNVVVKNIKTNEGDISNYLNQCRPIYRELDGWNEDIANVKNVEDIPENCMKYIALIEELTGIKISLVSVGATRKNKVRLC